MNSPEAAIANLVHRYAQHVDAGELEDAAALFTHAQINLRTTDGNEITDASGLLEHWRRVAILYDDGTPRTKHIMTNLIIEVSDDGDWATCSSYYTVLQVDRSGAMAVILAGRYLDQFQCSDGEWRFSAREYCPANFVGDVSRHRRSEPTPGPASSSSPKTTS